MSKHEFPQEFDESNSSAEEQIKEFNAQFAESRNLMGFGEEIASCSLAVRTLVRSGELTQETLSTVFQRAHKTIPTGATYILAYRALEEAAESGKLNGELFQAVQESVMNDKDPLWTFLGKAEERNTNIMRQLLTNDRLFNLMLPYISS